MSTVGTRRELRRLQHDGRLTELTIRMLIRLLFGILPSGAEEVHSLFCDVPDLSRRTEPFRDRICCTLFETSCALMRRSGSLSIQSDQGGSKAERREKGLLEAWRRNIWLCSTMTSA